MRKVGDAKRGGLDAGAGKAAADSESVTRGAPPTLVSSGQVIDLAAARRVRAAFAALEAKGFVIEEGKEQ